MHTWVMLSIRMINIAVGKTSTKKTFRVMCKITQDMFFVYSGRK
jgi:hypothetical protein